ncbi:GNAT family N-acetyltransferase [Virgibacillus ainsalahensis]
MISIQKATSEHVDGIAKVCIDSYWATYGDLLSRQYIERMIKEFYTRERLLKEVTETNKQWNGWIVALDGGTVIGAGVGGMISENHGELFTLYLDPSRRKEGLGTRILNAVTVELRKYGAKEQWVNVTKGNRKGIPFYESKGFQFIHEQDEYGIIEGEDFKALRYHRLIEVDHH